MLVTDSIPLTIFRFNVDLPDLLGNENQSFYFFFFFEHIYEFFNLFIQQEVTDRNRIHTT